jgi:acyl-CoA synthetase (AMP-forming)/AMP-acid ligase II
MELTLSADGEILGRGFGMFDGYWNDPVRTAEVIDADGWFHTGDLGAFDADGRIMYLGRSKDMLKVGGENVAALEVESYLCTHPDVRFAQVVGVPDERLGEVVAAFLELEPGASVGLDDVVEFCRGRIASYKIPRQVRVVDEWPMSATKIQKFKLREQLVAQLSAVRSA